MALDKGGVTGALRAQIEKTHESQHDDAEITEAMIGGASMQAAKKQPEAKSAKKPTAKPAPAKATKPAEHDMHDMSDMSGMDHK